MAKAQNHFYVLVFTGDGPVYVTSLDYSTRYAHFDKAEVPKEMDKNIAHDIALGLNLNGYLAQVVHSKWEIEDQPYQYWNGKFEWTKNEKEEE